MPAINEAPDPVDLSLVVNIFREGRLIHPTLRSLADSVRAVLAAGSTAEVILVLDRTDLKTHLYLDEFGVDLFDGIPTHRVLVENGDLGLSRNSGVRFSRGRVIAFSDDDNLYSANWLVDALRTLDDRPQERVILHPSVLINFEARDIYWESEWTSSPTFDPRGLVENNYWDASCVGPRRVFEEVPYTASLAGVGFGPEDWQWNCETVEQGWGHEAIPESVMFYRVKNVGSLISRLESGQALLAPTAFLTHRPDGPKSTRATASDQRVDARFRRTLSTARRFVRLLARASRPLAKIHPRVSTFGHQIAPAVVQLLEPPHNVVGRGTALRFPDWLVDAWRAAHEYEPALFPTADRMASMYRWEPRAGPYSRVYWDLIDELTVDGSVVDYVFLMPWRATGGVDTVLQNYLRGIAQLDPASTALVLLTVPRGDRRPVDDGRVRYRSLPDEFFSLAEFHQARLLGTALVQLAPRVVHLINSPIGFRLFERYSRLVHSRSRLYLSLFTLDQSPEGQKMHYALQAIRDYADDLDAIITDNLPLAELLVDTYALDASRVVVHHQTPAEAVWDSVGVARHDTRSSRLRVLWAGRLDRQKRPDLLIRVAERSRELGLPIDFVASGPAVLDGSSGLTSRMARAGIRYVGEYHQNLATIPGPFDVLLLTSQWEGLPLTLLDGALQGMTLVGPAVGGIPDFIDNQRTGFLVVPFDDVEAYVQRLAELAADPDLLQSTRAKAATKVVEEHSWQAFTETLGELPGYVGI
jgi:glycosyltransferase involved in cell wall biosynthesis